MTKTTVRNGAVTLPVTRSGAGQQVVFVNGVGSTQIAWKRVVAELDRAYETITFDLRGHGKASPADTYTFDGFLADTEAVLTSVRTHKPIIVGWSMGADLAVSYTTTHPHAVAGLVLVDGAVPIRETLVEDEARMRRSLNSVGLRLAMRVMRLTPYGYAIPPDAIADLTIEVDQRRQQLLDVYRTIDCPITMILATNTAGGNDARADYVNRVWREGAERPKEANPAITTHWVDGTHKLPFSHPAEIARTIDHLAQQSPQRQ